MSENKLGQLRFFMVPPELLHYRSKLTNPKNPNKLYEFTPAMKLIMISFFELCNPTFAYPARTISYDEISDHTNISVSTISKVMPILLHNFKGKYFSNIKKEFGGSYKFNFCYDFKTPIGKVNFDKTLDEKIDDFKRTCNDEDIAKWTLLDRMPMDSLKSKWSIFQKYQKYDYAFWLRNVTYCKSEFDRMKWKVVPPGWLYKCLENDYAYNRLRKSDKKTVLNNIPNKKVNDLLNKVTENFAVN